MHGSRASGISELRRRELEQQAAEEEASIAQLRLAAAIAEAKAQAARRATELARTSSNARSRSHAGDHGSLAATEQLHSEQGADGNTPAPAAHDGARDTPSLQPAHTTVQHERPRAVGSIEGTNVIGIAAENLPNIPRCPITLMPGDSTLSFAPSSQGPISPEAVAQYGAQLALTANPPNVSTPLARSGLVGPGLDASLDARQAAAASSSTAPAAQFVQRQCPIPPTMQQTQAFAPGSQHSMFGIFGLGPGSPGPLGGTLNPPPMQAFKAPPDQPASCWAGSPPGISVVPTTGVLHAAATGIAKSAAVPHAKPSPSFMMPSHLATGGTPLFEASVAAKAAATATAHAHGTQNIQNTQNIAKKHQVKPDHQHQVKSDHQMSRS